MQTRMESLSSATATNHIETREILSQILQVVTSLSVGNQALSRVIEVQDQDVPKGLSDKKAHASNGEPCAELTDIVTRLHARVDDNKLQGKIMSGEAKGIVKDLLLALETMSSEEFLQGICSTCRESHVCDLRTSLTTVHAALLPTRQVMVNDVGRSKYQILVLIIHKRLTRLVDRVQQHALGSYGQSKWAVSASETSFGMLSVTSRTRSQRTQQLSPVYQSGLQGQTQTEEEEVTTSVSLILRHSQVRRAFKIHIRQTYRDDGILSGIPHLSVHNVLPMNSPVFEIVQRGRLREFQVLLREGKVSLRDQDEYGASLLMVRNMLLLTSVPSLSHSFQYANEQPEMCRYLIESGADVDHVARIDTIQGHLGRPFMYVG